MNKVKLTKWHQIFTIVVACVSGFILAVSLSLIIYDSWLYGFLSVIMVFLMAPIALVSLTTLLISTAYAIKRDWEKSRLGYVVFGVVFIFTTVSSIGCKILLDSPEVLLHATFDGRSKVDLYLRKDMSVKCEENHMLGVNESYGSYHINGDTLFLENVSIKYCGNAFANTLLFEEDYIRFLVNDNACSIENTEMHIWVNRLD